MNSHEVFIHIHQGCFAGTGAIVRLPQCQWSKPDGYGKISPCITTTKHSKAKTVCIFLGIYCIWENVKTETLQNHLKDQRLITIDRRGQQIIFYVLEGQETKANRCRTWYIFFVMFWCSCAVDKFCFQYEIPSIRNILVMYDFLPCNLLQHIKLPCVILYR